VLKTQICLTRPQCVKKCGQDRLGIRLARVYDSATIVFAKAFITYDRVTVQATNVLAVDVFGMGIFD